MYKIHAVLAVVLALITTAVVKLDVLMPQPTANIVLAEKSDGTSMGGRAAVLVPNDLTSSQHLVLNAAYAQAVADGHKHPELVQGVLLQESKAGGLASYKVAGNPGDQYYGLMQMKIGAAMDVLSTYPSLYKKYKFQTQTRDEVIANLILNPTFSIELGSKYLKILATRYNLSGNALLVAYNQGPSGASKLGDPNTHPYASGVRAKLLAMRP